MSKKVVVLVLSALLVLMTVVPAFAADGTITLTGGSLSVVPAAISFTGFALDGQPHLNVAGTTTAWTAMDPTGTGAGWHVNISATDFENEDENIIPITGFEMTLPDAAIALVQGNTQPTSSLATAKALETAAQKMASAAVGEGMGTYTMLPTFTLDVPAETYAGTYTSVITVEIVAAP